MQSHRIPQHVTGWHGRIIGHFTAHQFIYLAIGAIIIFILITNPFLPVLYKVGGVVVTALVTVLFALANYEGRSTDTWIINYLRAIIRPTQRIWLKEKENPPVFLLPSFTVPQKRIGPKKKNIQDLNRFLQLWGTQKKESDLTQEEEKFLERLKKL